MNTSLRAQQRSPNVPGISLSNASNWICRHFSSQGDSARHSTILKRIKLAFYGLKSLGMRCPSFSNSDLPVNSIPQQSNQNPNHSARLRFAVTNALAVGPCLGALPDLSWGEALSGKNCLNHGARRNHFLLDLHCTPDWHRRELEVPRRISCNNSSGPRIRDLDSREPLSAKNHSPNAPGSRND